LAIASVASDVDATADHDIEIEDPEDLIQLSVILIFSIFLLCPNDVTLLLNIN
jgi:hypothetical protein